MPAISPVTLLEKEPIPVPSLVFVVNEMVGFAEVLQHTPRAVTAEPPLDEIFPPEVADAAVIFDTVKVETFGVDAVVLNEMSAPYAVPIALVAYART